MFAEHQPKIAARNPENFFQVMQFVILTIQQPLHRVVLDMPIVNDLGIQAPCLWGMKVPAWLHFKANAGSIYDMAMTLDHANPDPARAEQELLTYFASLPGMGLVKGGFLLQLVFGLGGCLDTHNLDRYELPASKVKASRYKQAKTKKGKDKIIGQYLSLCHELGGAERLWDTWCEYVYARNRGDAYTSAHHVSAMHPIALGLN